MIIGHKLSKNDKSTEVNQTLCRSMIGKLQYVVHNRHDIALSVGIVARFSNKPKRKLSYDSKENNEVPKGIDDFGLYYKRNEK